MKICFITTGLTMGGAERQICDLSDQLHKSNNEIMIISLTGESVVKPKCKSVKVICLNMRKSPIGLIRALRECYNIFKSFNPDVVHSHMIHANIFARILRIFTKMPMLVCTAHNTNEGGTARIFAYRFSNFMADVNTNVSQEAVDEFVKSGAVKPGGMIAVSNGIDNNRFVFSEKARNEKRQELNIQDDCFLYLAIGRLEEQKDYPNILHAMQIVINKAINGGGDIKLAIIGNGCLELKLKQLTKDLGLSDHVIFLGLQRDVECWLSAADCFVLPSKFEGFGLVVAEALLTERLVVATDCGGVKEVLGDDGFLVFPQNPELFAIGMLNAFNMNKKESAKLVKRGRNRIISNYAISAVAGKWIEIYRNNK